MDEGAPDTPFSSDPAGLADALHGAVRGALGAMAMTGMRTFTSNAGIVGEAPPQAIVRQRIPGMGRLRVRRKRRRMFEELLHWAYGAGGGAAFAVLPESVRSRTWAGPAYGMAIWLGFEAGIAPVLGLKQAAQPRPAERAALAVDHLLYGFVLSETRRRDAR
jgi:hypothetical protein